MAQTTTQIGRMKVAHPDLGYDTADGGVNLHAALAAMFTNFSDHISTRWFPGLSVTASGGLTPSVDVVHNYGVALSELKYLVYVDGTLQSKAELEAVFTISAPDTNTLRFTNTSGSPHTLIVYVRPVKEKIEVLDLDSELRAVQVIQAGSTLASTYNGSILCLGAVTVAVGGTTVNGSMTVVTGNITGAVSGAGRSLTVKGDLYTPGNVNLAGTVASGAGPAGGSLTVEGDAYIGGQVVTSGAASSDSGQVGGAGGSITISKDFFAGNYISTNGGNATDANGGNAGSITVKGSIRQGFNDTASPTTAISMVGGGVTLTTGSATTGAGGNLNVEGDCVCKSATTTGKDISTVSGTRVSGSSAFDMTIPQSGYIKIGGDLFLHAGAYPNFGTFGIGDCLTYGANSSDAIAGGAAGKVTVYGNAVANILAYGGSSSSSGNGGAGAAVTIGGNILYFDYFLTNGGASAAAHTMGGHGGNVYVGGSAYSNHETVGNLTIKTSAGGATRALNPGMGGTITIGGNCLYIDTSGPDGTTYGGSGGAVIIGGNVKRVYAYGGSGSGATAEGASGGNVFIGGNCEIDVFAYGGNGVGGGGLGGNITIVGTCNGSVEAYGGNSSLAIAGSGVGGGNGGAISIGGNCYGGADSHGGSATAGGGRSGGAGGNIVIKGGTLGIKAYSYAGYSDNSTSRNGGNINIYGSFSSGRILCYGNSCLTGTGGSSGTLRIKGNASVEATTGLLAIDASGGNGVIGGYSNGIIISGNLHCSSDTGISAKGGNGSAGSGGNGGGIVVDGNLLVGASGAVSSYGGSGTVAGGNGGPITVQGQVIADTVNSYGGAGNSSSGGAAGNVSLGSVRATTGIYAFGNLGTTGGSGASVACYGDFVGGEIQSKGGSPGNGPGKNAGSVTINGNAYLAGNIDASGSNASGATGGVGGSGGSITISGNCNVGAFSLISSGGNALVSGAGGAGGSVTIGGNFYSTAATSIESHGGSGLSAVGGAGGAINIRGNYSGRTVYANGASSTGNTGGAGAAITVGGNASIVTGSIGFDTSGGAGTTGGAGAGQTVGGNANIPSMNTKGGNGSSSVGGTPGNVFIYGNAWVGSITTDAGTSGTGAGKAGGTINVYGNLVITTANCTANGGSGSTTGGAGGAITLKGNVACGTFGIYSVGGAGSGGAGGTGGAITIEGDLTSSGEITALGGNGAGGAGGAGGAITLKAIASCGDINSYGGNATTSTFAGGTAGVLKLSGGMLGAINAYGGTSAGGVAGSPPLTVDLTNVITGAVTIRDGSSGTAPVTTCTITLAGSVYMGAVTLTARDGYKWMGIASSRCSFTCTAFTGGAAAGSPKFTQQDGTTKTATVTGFTTKTFYGGGGADWAQVSQVTPLT